MNSEEILIKAFEELKHIPLSINGYTIELCNINNHNNHHKIYDLFNWIITLLGAKDSPYADGIFFIKVSFPGDYPKSAPRIYFLTPIYHMNVSSYDGRVSVNYIEQDWKETTSVRQILTKLYSIFYLFNPDSPFSLDQAHLYKSNPDLYYLRAEYFTHKYANIKSFEDFKPFNNPWDFSFPLKRKSIEINKNINNNEKIKLNFHINGDLKNFSIECNSNKILREIIYENHYENKIGYVNLLIYEGRKLDESRTIGENGLKNEGIVTIITDVHY